MKFLVLALFVAVATAAPIDDDGGPVEVILNGVPEGEPIDLSDIVDIKLKEHSNGEVAATNLLHPFTAVGIAEAAAAAAEDSTIENPVIVVQPEAVQPDAVIPEPVVLPPPVAPEVAPPAPIVLPAPADPEVVIPEPVSPPQDIVPSPVVVEPIPPSPPTGEIFNDGVVSVTVNAPQEAGVFSSLQGWFSMVLNYFNNGVQTTQEIV